MLLLLSLAILPALVIIGLVYFSDRYDREPIPLLFLSFFLGMVSALIALVLEIAYQAIIPISGSLFLVLMHAVFGVGLMEEYSKWIFLRYNLYRRRAFNEPVDGIIYGVMIAMGFATFENILYVYEGGVQVALMRAFTAVPAHASFGVIMGYYVGKAKYSFGLRKKVLLIYALLSATLLHGLYDFFLFQRESEYLYIFSAIVLIFSVTLSVKALRNQRRNSPHRPFVTPIGKSSQEENEPGL